MKLEFYKYHGTGNDFVLIDQMQGNQYELTTEQIALICHRRFGIGADGFMFLRPSKDYDFEMVYYNSDGNVSTMCGNGGRCIVKFAKDRGHINDQCTFTAIDGIHDAKVLDNEVSLGMINVEEYELKPNDDFALFTGSPHYVHFGKADDLKNITKYGKSIRYNEEYKKEGINVNIVVPGNNHIRMATYERGVEDETYSCGTGVVAAAICYALKRRDFGITKVKTKGGDLSVSFKHEDGKFRSIKLQGPATFVFKGEINI